ncbi:hypothetical protein [Streptomyces sp. NPDC004135]
MSAYISECGYCHETGFTNWFSKSAPHDRYGRIDRDYVDSRPVAYCSEEHRDAADAVRELGALPVPVGVKPLAAEGRARTMLDHAREALNARMVKDDLRLVLENVITYAAERQDENEKLRDHIIARDAEIERLRARLEEFQRPADEDPIALSLTAKAEALSYPLALPWAHAMSDDDLHGFLGDLVSAAMGRWQHSPEVPDREVLAAVERACAAWRTPGQGYRSDEPAEDDVTPQVAKLRALLAGQREQAQGGDA